MWFVAPVAGDASLGAPLHAASARPRFGPRDLLAGEYRFERAPEPRRVPEGIPVVSVRRTAEDQPLLSVEHEDVWRDLGPKRVRDILGLVVQVRVRPVVLAYEALHVLERVGRVARRVVAVNTEKAHAACRVLLGHRTQPRIPRDHVRAVQAGDDETVWGFPVSPSNASEPEASHSTKLLEH